MISNPSRITGLLHSWGKGDPEALNQLIPIVYDRLHQLAHQRMRNEPGVCSINTTGLVHEAYLKMVATPQVTVRDRGHFLSLASRVMRRILVDHARARNAAKRGGGVPPLELKEAAWISDEDLDSIAALNQALERLAELDPRQSQMLEQRYFGGLSLEEIALATGRSPATVKRELRSARAWLAAELGRDSSL